LLPCTLNVIDPFCERLRRDVITPVRLDLRHLSSFLSLVFDLVAQLEERRRREESLYRQCFL
jgi:hypothetical protein